MIRIDPAQLENSDVREVLKYLIAKYSPARERRLRDYYEGRHDILERKMADPTKPNNKLVNNLAAFITDTVTGYFMGQPVVYSSDGEENDGYVETLKDIFDFNNEQDHNAELGKGQSIAGVDYELLYLDEEARIRFTELPTENVIYVESDDIDEKPLMAVRIYETDNIKQPDQKLYYYEVYTDSEIITYTAQRHNENVSLTEVDRQPHYFGEVPVIAYPNNKEQMGDFEGVIHLIDAYNKAQSDTANDFEYFTDAYLKLTGVRLDDQAIATMKENRVIGLPDKECDVDWLVKQINDAALENYKNRLRKDIHSLSKTPNLSDESFSGNLTGVAISYKIWGMDQVVSVKERKFKKALQRRIKLITNVLNAKGNNWDWRKIEITFSRNMPQNLVELAQMVGQLKGIVSDETLIALLPFVTDVTMEIERLAEQSEGIPDLDNLPPVGDVDDLTEEV
jgi:SPP1 family phage portal protein